MKKVVITDPEYGKQVFEIEEDISDEALAEISAYMDDDTRYVWARNKKEERHCPYSIDSLDFDGMEYADTNTPETIVIGEEEETTVDDYLSVLSAKQRERILMRLEDTSLTYSDIARLEGTDPSTVRESLHAAFKKLKKFFPGKFDFFEKTPPKKP